MNRLEQKIKQMAAELEPELIAVRRDIHKHPESGWTEFRTASMVAETLNSLGYEVLIGDEVMDSSRMMGVPPSAELARHMERAVSQGAIKPWVGLMTGGKTAVVGILRCGKSGPTAAFRFDMDANDVVESQDPSHRPAREGFSSINEGAHHGCGHDGHTSMGLAVAKILASIRNELNGTIKLVFQPAEEGLRGALPIAESGILDDVDYLLGVHVAGARNTIGVGVLASHSVGLQASTKFDVKFTGLASHAGSNPEDGRNALLAGATALLNIHAIARNSKGSTGINVGTFNGGTGRNVVADTAVLKVETRGNTSEINQYMYDRAMKIVEGAALMHEASYTVTPCGNASGCVNDQELIDIVETVAGRIGGFTLVPYGECAGSEDLTTLMNRVQRHGGKATAMLLGTTFAGTAHSATFDFDEKCLALGTELIASILADIVKKDS